jgi:hypothetical protein
MCDLVSGAEGRSIYSRGCFVVNQFPAASSAARRMAGHGKTGVEFRLSFADDGPCSMTRKRKRSGRAEGGTRGPVLLKWIRQLLEDRAERVQREHDAGRRAAPAADDGGGALE